MSKASLFSKLASGNGNLIPDSDEHRDLGSANNKWKDLYLSGSSLILGNVTLKDSGGIPSFENLGGAKVKLDMSAMTTADLAEHNTARYFTETRTRSSFSFSTGSADYDSATGGFTIPTTTDHVTEGTNLYYTDARADTRAQLKIDALVNAAPSQLDTLDELAAALGDDSNFAGTVSASIGANTTLINTKLDTVTDVAVTVAGGKFVLDGQSQATLHLQPGRTYKFDQSNSSNSSHPLRFSTTSDGTHNSGSQYTSGVTTSGTPGFAGAYVQIVVTFGTPALFYYCANHSGMGAGSVAATSNIWSNISGTPTTISGYGITDAFDGAYGSLTGVPSTFTPSAHNQAWSTITSTPTTISGYGITDAFDGAFGSLSGTPTTISGYGITDAQATLVSGTNIKTVNGTTLLGSGNISISSGSSGTDSATVSSIILSDVDSAYVQARQSGGGSGISLTDLSVTTASASGGGALSYNSSTGVFTFAPSTNSGGGSGTVDSAQTISLITNTVDSDYIIARSASGTSMSGGVNTYVYIADSGQTTFSGSDNNSNTLSFTSNNLAGYLNGVLLIGGDDYTLSNGNTFTLTFAADSADEISIVAFDPASSENISTYFDSDYITDRIRYTFPARGSITNYFYTADSGQTVFTGADDNGASLVIDQDNSNIIVSVNGVLIINEIDYTTTASSNTLTLIDSASAGDQIAINTFSNLYRSPGIDSQDMLDIVDSAYINQRISEIFVSTDIVDSAYINQRINEIYPGDRSIDTFRYVSTEGQAIYTGNDANGNTLAFSDGAVQVHLNGILLTKSQDYTTSSGNSITLLDSINAGNEVLIENFANKFILNLDDIVDSAYVAARIPASSSNIGKFKFTTSTPQSVFTGNDDNGNLLQFDSNNIIVFLNGVSLFQGEDFTTSDGDTVTLSAPADSNFEVVINDFHNYSAIALTVYSDTDVESLVDSAYVQARQDLSSIDSAYIQARQASVNLTSVSQDIIPDFDSSRSLGTPTKKWKDLYLSGGTLHIGGVQIKEDTANPGKIVFEDSAGSVAFSTSGSLEVSASGTLANGDLVVINSDGTVSVVSETTPTESLGSPAIFESAEIYQFASTYDVNANRIVICYGDGGNSYHGTAVVGEVSGTSITFGTPVVFNTNPASYACITYDANAQKVVIGYRSNNDAKMAAVVGTVSSNSISFGTVSMLTGPNPYDVNVVYDANAQKVVFTYRDIGNNNYGGAVVGTVTGTSISFGTHVVFQSSYIQSPELAYDENAQKIVVFFHNAGNNNNSTAKVGTISGTSITFGSAATTSNYTYENAIVYAANAQKMVVIYRDANNSGKGTYRIGTVSGTSITLSSPVVFYNGNGKNYNAAYDANAEKITISFFDASNSNAGTLINGSVGASSITFGTATVFDTDFAVGPWVSYDSFNKKMVIAYENNDNNQYGTAIVFQNAGGSVTNLTSTNYIGISNGAYTNGQTATIQTIGSVDDAQSGLTIGKHYFVQTDGTLSTTAGTPSVFAGTAISSNKIIIKG